MSSLPFADAIHTAIACSLHANRCNRLPNSTDINHLTGRWIWKFTKVLPARTMTQQCDRLDQFPSSWGMASIFGNFKSNLRYQRCRINMLRLQVLWKTNNANVVLTIIVCIQQAVLIGTSGPRHGNLVFVYNSIAVSCKVDLPRFTLLKTYFQQNQLTRVQLVCPARPARLGTRNRICSCWTQSCTVQCCNQKWGCVKCSLQFGLWRMDGRTDSERERETAIAGWIDVYMDTRTQGYMDGLIDKFINGLDK